MKTLFQSKSARTALVVGVIAAALALTVLVGPPGLDLLRDNQELLLDWRSSNLAGLIAGLIAANVVVVALCLPGSFVVTVASGFLFGFWHGTLLAVISGAIGACLVFLWVRAGFGDRIQERLRAQSVDSVTARLLATIHNNEIRCLILMRVLPVVPFMVANVAPALLGIGMRRFAVTTLIGIAPGTALTAWIGAGAATALERDGTAEFTTLISPEVYGVIAAVCLLTLAPLVIRRVPLPLAKARRQRSSSEPSKIMAPVTVSRSTGLG